MKILAFTLAILLVLTISGIAWSTPEEEAPADKDEKLEEAPVPGLPPGHPPIAGSGVETGPMDDPSIPSGSIHVQASGLPPNVLQSLEVSLLVWERSRGEATIRTLEKRRLDASGTSHFQVEAGRDAVLSISVNHEGIPYSSPAFRMGKDSGKRVPVRLFPIVTDIDRALVGVQSFLYIEPRDHHIRIEQMFQFSNLSDVTWRAGVIPVSLPTGASALATSDEPGPLILKAVPGSGVLLEGVVPPGKAEIAFQYQLPYPKDGTLRLDLGMPPRVGFVQLMATLAPGLILNGLGQPSVSRNERGQRLLIANHAIQPGGDQIENLSLSVIGFPTNRFAYWAALSMALVLMAAGLILALRSQQQRPARKTSLQPLLQHRDSLIKALTELQSRPNSNDPIEKTEVERAALLDQLAHVLFSLSQEKGGDKDGERGDPLLDSHTT